MPLIVLKEGRDQSLRRRHPWLFSGAIARIEGRPQPGETADIVSHQGEWLARGSYSPSSQIAARVWSFEPAEGIAPPFFRDRLQRALEKRRLLGFCSPGSAWRLVNAESDGLPGLVVDCYGDFLACQFVSAGAEFWKECIVEELVALIPCAGVYERSDVAVRQKEGLPLSKGALQGAEPPALVEIREGECRFWVDLREGHKTGFYLDQRDNRALAACWAAGKEILNVFSYTGGFAIVALKAGARRAVNIDSSPRALELAAANVSLNDLDESTVKNLRGDAFSLLRRLQEEGRLFDLVILDPPKFAEAKVHLGRATRAYKDINMQAFKLLRPGGLLFTFSCSGVLQEPLFQKIVADAALDAGRQAHILQRLFQAPDHLVGLPFPEGAYLKGLLCGIS